MSMIIPAAKGSQGKYGPGTSGTVGGMRVDLQPQYGLWGGITGALGGFATGGLGGAIAGGITGLFGGGKKKRGQPPAMPGTGLPGRTPPVFNPPFMGPPGVGVGLPGGPRVSVGERMALPSDLGWDPYVGSPVDMPRKPFDPPGGYHWNKQGYWTKSQGYVGRYTKLIKNRRKNPMNPDALSRAIRRVESADKLKKTLSRVTVRKRKAC